ncbi:MAG: adenylyltransferase/cytidyltransferase family protein, partial [Rheinheimera sp.]|nr:adenylyltransferase/cytidyltransferase family protein [Rheinheimera sp.]
MKTGVFPGKFLPPHRGHITAILRAHALCDKLY